MERLRTVWRSLRPLSSWLLLGWASSLALVYVTRVLDLRTTGAFFGWASRSVVYVFLTAAPIAVLSYLELRTTRKNAVTTLGFLTGGIIVYVAIAANILGALTATSILLVATYGYGRVLTHWARLDARGVLHDTSLSLATGWPLLIVLGTFLGTTGTLTRPVVVAAMLLGIALAILGARHAPRQESTIAEIGSDSPALPAAWSWALILLLLIGFVGAVAPEIRHDALAAHLPIAREFARQGRIVEIRNNIVSYFQLNGSLPYAVGLIIVRDESVPKLLHYSAGVITTLLVYSVGSRAWHARVGLGAAAVVAGTPLVLWTEGTAYTDLWVALFAITATYLLITFHDNWSARRGLVLGLVVGSALGTKITSLIVLGPLVGILMPRVLLSLGSPRNRWRILVAFAVGVALTGSYWYGRAWVLTGNPTYPLLSSVFEPRIWYPREPRLNLSLFGMGTTLLNLLLLPWRLTRFPHRFVEEGDIGIAYLTLLPVMITGIARRQVSRPLLATLVVTILAWFFTAQYLRYLLPLLPLMALTGTGSLLPEQGAKHGVRVPVLALGVAILAGAGGWIFSGPPRFPLDVARGVVTRERYVAAYVPSYRVAQYVQTWLPNSAKIYGAGEDLVYYYDRYFVPLSWYGRPLDPTLPERMLTARTSREVQAALKHAGFNYLVAYPDYPVILRWRDPNGWLAREALWEEGPWLEYASRGFYLFRLEAANRWARALGPELLKNPEITVSSGAYPAGWQVHGTVNFVQERNTRKATRREAQMTRGSYVVQHVLVEPNLLYALKARMKTTATPGAVILLIQWRDSRSRLLDDEILRKVSLESTWKWYAIAGTAPSNAQTASVWLMADGNGEVTIDRATFHELE